MHFALVSFPPSAQARSLIPPPCVLCCVCIDSERVQSGLEEESACAFDLVAVVDPARLRDVSRQQLDSAARHLRHLLILAESISDGSDTGAGREFEGRTLGNGNVEFGLRVAAGNVGLRLRARRRHAVVIRVQVAVLGVAILEAGTRRNVVLVRVAWGDGGKGEDGSGGGGGRRGQPTLSGPSDPACSAGQRVAALHSALNEESHKRATAQKSREAVAAGKWRRDRRLCQRVCVCVGD